jgi:AcrR family transcriptional regulator
MSDVKRRNKPTLRQRQAQVTHNLIVEAAQALFLENGYTGTTIEAIADEAGVAVSTVYAVFGSKRGILRAIREAWHERSHIREVAYGEPGDNSPAQRIEQLALATRQQWESGSDVLAIYTGAAHADSQAAIELEEALHGRRKGLENFARSLEPHLRSDLSVDSAAAILQALCMPEVFEELVKRSGWTVEAYQEWLAGILKRELLKNEKQKRAASKLDST